MIAGGLRNRLRGVPGPHRRWILVHAVGVTAGVNLVVNAGIAWVSVLGQGTVPLWSVPLLEGQSTIADTVATLFFLPLITCVVCTTAVWQEVRAGRLTPLRGPPAHGSVIDRLPAGRLPRGLAAGAYSTVLLAPPVTVVIVALHIGDLSPGTFVACKAAFAVGLGALVTPVIALRAMADVSVPLALDDHHDPRG